MPILLWGHAGLSVLVVVARFLAPEIRDKVVRVLCAAGAGVGIALFLARRSGDTWRSVVIEPETAVLAGVAVAVAWVIAAVLLDEDDRWRAAALVGAGSTALVLFATTTWIVPALLFWALTSLVAGAIALTLRAPAEMWIGIVFSDLCFAAGMIGHVLDSDAWELPSPVAGRAFWFLLAAAILRVGAVPRFGLWRSLGSSAAVALPLLAGGGLVLAAGPAGRVEPWAAVGLLVLALAQAVWGALRQRLEVANIAGWPSAIALALIYVAPAVAELAGTAALLALGCLVLWPIASGHAQPERGLLLTLVPPTAVFGAIVYVATRAFDVSTTLDASLESAPWIAVTALIPLVMASGVLLAARVGRERAAEVRHAWPVGATRLFVAASVAIGFVPGALELPDDVIGSQRSFLTLMAVALGVAALAGWAWNLRHPDHRRAPVPEPTVSPVAPPTSRDARAFRSTDVPLVERVLGIVALALALATFVAIGWITYEGLSQGFL
jgi:hypothetical protein